MSSKSSSQVSSASEDFPDLLVDFIFLMGQKFVCYVMPKFVFYVLTSITACPVPGPLLSWLRVTGHYSHKFSRKPALRVAPCFKQQYIAY